MPFVDAEVRLGVGFLSRSFQDGLQFGDPAF